MAYAAAVFAENDYDVIGFDLRGHGKSEGMRGNLCDINVLVRDAIDFLKASSIYYTED
eukprot:CAMPEP_0201281552 /NCGR_PEP_ID=MMETSP1317-20130820/3263_1 /ASSEMBLY_ACC=CAM_ASM_000770 /TAXON_ID=187299 /ORGANISM="Undescribed Undescribed, Strain Undescribed" /LENGTH=57 /DNA_ID=CAMNT_0047591673 /DNA_START=196 /DNA_END=369 /DNA_ORIENTATION=+